MTRRKSERAGAREERANEGDARIAHTSRSSSLVSSDRHPTRFVLPVQRFVHNLVSFSRISMKEQVK